MYLVTAGEMQRMDKETIGNIGIPGRILMENAGSGAFRFMCRVFPDLVEKSVGVVAGSGNNGGDGFVMARYLSQKGISVKVYLLCEKGRVQGDARANLDLLAPLGIPVVEIPDTVAFKKQKAAMRRHDVWVDGYPRHRFEIGCQGLLQGGDPVSECLEKACLCRGHPLRSECRQWAGLRCLYTGAGHSHICLSQDRSCCLPRCGIHG